MTITNQLTQINKEIMNYEEQLRKIAEELARIRWNASVRLIPELGDFDILKESIKEEYIGHYMGDAELVLKHKAEAYVQGANRRMAANEAMVQIELTALGYKKPE